jgi:hypothetical protein
MCMNSRFTFSVVSNHVDYDNETNVIEFVECDMGNLSYDVMEKIVDDLLGDNKIPSGVPNVRGLVYVLSNGDVILDSYVVKNHDQSLDHVMFEFGVSLNEIEFVQNWEGSTEEECLDILTKLMETNQFETDEKTFGLVYWEKSTNVYYVQVRPYVDGWSWDFDHEDTTELEITL